MHLTTISLVMQVTPVRILPLGHMYGIALVVVVGTASSDCFTTSCGSVLPAVPGYSRGQGQEQASLRAIGVRMTIAERGVTLEAVGGRLHCLFLPHIICPTSGASDGFREIEISSGGHILRNKAVPVVGRWGGGWRGWVVGRTYLLVGLVGRWGGRW